MDWVEELDARVQQITAAISDGIGVATQNLYDNVVDRARQTPGWDMLADDITVWRYRGEVHIGIQSQLLQSQAEAAEFGDAQNPPTGLMRSLQGEAQSAGKVFDSHLRNRLTERF